MAPILSGCPGKNLAGYPIYYPVVPGMMDTRSRHSTTTVSYRHQKNEMTEPIIRTNHLTRHFGDTIAVADLTLDVYPGEIFGFLGHNGAGKTTTVRLLNGVLAPSRGSAEVLGFLPARDGAALRRHTGVLTETPSLDERLTGRENLEIYAELYAVAPAEVPTRIKSLLAFFQLDARAEDKVAGYSKGMKQRLALARALLHKPRILFLDEPTSGLDPVAARQVHELVRRLSREEGRTVFLCTHNLAEAQQLCDRVGVMEHGELIALGTPAALAERMTASSSLELEVAPESGETALTVLRREGLAPEPGSNGTIQVTGAGREAIPDLLEALIRGGVRVYRVAPQTLSLSDAYFALHEEQAHFARKAGEER